MLKTREQVIEMINNKVPFSAAGEMELLEGLPRGNWIGGSIPYFMSENGGVLDRNKIFVNEIPSSVNIETIKLYNTENLSEITEDGSDTGFSLIIIPAFSDTHKLFAEKAPELPDLFIKPLIGWISGFYLEDASGKAEVIDGTTGVKSATEAIVMHCSLPSDQIAELGIINLFEQGKGDTIEFAKAGFSTKEAFINGEKCHFAEYLKTKEIDTRLPLVANYSGARINVSFQNVDKDGLVDFYAPVFPGTVYRIAKPIEDYSHDFLQAIEPLTTEQVVFSCNCILNYLYSKLEGKKTGTMTGPITFGEIAYQLLNQTLVYLNIRSIK